MKFFAWRRRAAGWALPILFTGCGDARAPEQVAAETARKLQEAQQQIQWTQAHVTQAVQRVEQAVRAPPMPAPDAVSTNAPPGAADFRELRKRLPAQVGEWKRVSGSGQRTRVLGIEVAQVVAHYAGPDQARVTITLSDAGTLRGVAAWMGQAWAMAEIDREDDHGFERTLHLEGADRGYQRYDRATRRGEIHLLLENRFLVHIEGEGVDWEDLARAEEGIDRKGLAAEPGRAAAPQ
jgi:hypothetical protein